MPKELPWSKTTVVSKNVGAPCQKAFYNEYLRWKHRYTLPAGHCCLSQFCQQQGRQLGAICHQFDTRTSEGGRATVGTSPYHSLQLTRGSLFSPLCIFPPKSSQKRPCSASSANTLSAFFCLDLVILRTFRNHWMEVEWTEANLTFK